jgi:hypothetical protein
MVGLEGRMDSWAGTVTGCINKCGEQEGTGIIQFQYQPCVALMDVNHHHHYGHHLLPPPMTKSIGRRWSVSE